MSITKATTIWCDYCTNWYGDYRMPAKAMRKVAKKHGWTYKNGKDCCPNHKDKVR